MARIYPTYLFAVIVPSLLLWFGYQTWQFDVFQHIGRPMMGTYDLPNPIPNAFWLEAILKHLGFVQLISHSESLKFFVNPPLWSISAEVFFYLCFPLLISITARLQRVRSILLSLLGIYMTQFLLLQTFLPQNAPLDWFNINTWIYTNPLLRIGEFIMGMLLYRLYLSYPKSGDFSRLGLWIGIYLFIMYCNRYIPVEYSLFLFGLPCLLGLIYVTIYTSWQPEGKTRTFCTLLGGASYVLYATHWIIMEISHSIGFIPERFGKIFHASLLYIAIVSFSFAIHQWLEKPIRRAILQRFDKSNTKPCISTT
jgi:peptidoglycan/LPS O-acetylase OafA/YrhL